MKALVRLWPALLLSACQSMTGGNAGRVVGANDVVLVDRLSGLALDAPAMDVSRALNRYLFVTSTDTNELRVLDLAGESVCGASRCYVPGPNPLETLSIPVLDRPTSLVLDERYEDGVRRKGALLYATRPGGPEVSIVGVAPDELREVRRVSFPAPVTALAALMVDLETSRLFVATFDGETATVSELRFPSTPRALRKLTTAELVARATARLRFEGGSVVAMVPVPGLPGRRALGRPFCDDPGKACLAVATRRDSGSRGETTLFDLETLVAVPLAFPGPVRSLSTSDQVAPADESLAELRAKTPAPGSLLFGVLDEEACGSPACGGVAAVDTRGEAGPVGFEVVQSEGFASQPVRWSDGLVSGFTVAAGARVAVLDGGSYEVTPVPLLGSFTASNGELVFFDALEQRLFEQPGATASLGAVRYAPAALPDGGLPGYLSGPAIVGEAARVGEALVATSRATVVDGAFRSQDVEITWRGALTPAGGLPATSATRVALPGALARWVAVGDEVSFDGCDAVGSVSSVTGAQAIVRGAEACGAVRRASLRAAGERPFVVAATLDGLLGRARSGETFRYVGAPAVRLPGVDPTQPLLVVPFGSDTDTSPPLAGARWTLPIDAALSPLVSRVDINAFGATLTSCSATVTLPGALAYDVTRQRLFSVYPSGNVVVEFDPARTVRGPIGPNNGVFCYR